MAKRLPNGVIVLDNGEPFYGDDPVSAHVFFEVLPLLLPPPAWPFIGGGGGGIGMRGDLGSQGNQGLVGAPGPQGNQGNQGSQGAQGSQGFTGNQGLSGTSPQGPQGPQGNQGNQGMQGLIGLQGPQGNQGNQGNQGAQGNQGFRGFQGNQGNQGVTGDAQSAIFEFSHLSGTSSTGAIGFTPRFAIYSGIVEGISGDVSHVYGFSNATDQMSAGWGIGIAITSVDEGGVGAADKIFGEVAVDRAPPFSATSFFNGLTVTSFSSAGIELEWDMAVNEHSGKMLVVGTL